MKNFPTLQAFLFFVANSNPHTSITHDTGFSGCAVGLFTKFTHGKDMDLDIYEVNDAAGKIWQQVRHEADAADSDRVCDFGWWISNSSTESGCGAIKTMGELHEKIKTDFPELEIPKVTDLTTLRVAMAIRFPDIWIKDGAEFSEDHTDKLWTGEGSQVLVHFPEISDEYVIDVPAFDMHGGDMYEFGVYKPVADFLEQHGYYASAYDAGTFFIYEL